MQPIVKIIEHSVSPQGEHMDCGSGACPIDVRSDEDMKAA